MALTPDSIKDAVTKLWGEGLSMSQIGAQLGMTKGAVSGVKHRLNLSPRGTPIKPPVEERDRRQEYMKAFRERKKEEKKAKQVLLLEDKNIFKPRIKWQCQWIDGEPSKLNFCSCDALAGKPYCQAHYDRAYVPVKVWKRIQHIA